MAYQSRSLSSNLRNPSIDSSQTSSGQSPILIARINEKRAELENLKQLRDLSAELAAQMQTLEDKISMLSDGTEAVAAVLSNWHNVLRAINMASMKLPKSKSEESDKEVQDISAVPLPQTLVRIPVAVGSQQIDQQISSAKED